MQKLKFKRQWVGLQVENLLWCQMEGTSEVPSI